MARAVLVAVIAIGSGACSREAPPARPAPGPAAASPPAVSSAAPVSAASPIAVQVALASKGASPSALAQDWAKELEAVLSANPAQFRLVKSANAADLTVSIERVVTPPESPGHQVMTLWVSVRGEPARFTLDYTGGPAVMAGRLSRFLLLHVQKVQAGGARAAASPAAAPSR